MAKPVSAEQYWDLDGQIEEIKRQLRQKGGYPYSPTALGRALQQIIDGHLRPTTLVVNYDDPRWTTQTPNTHWGAEVSAFPVLHRGLAVVEFQLIEFDEDPTFSEVFRSMFQRGLGRGDRAEIETYLDNDPDDGRFEIAGVCLTNRRPDEEARVTLISGVPRVRGYFLRRPGDAWFRRSLFLTVRSRQPIVLR